ncbi:putative PGG domain-containing protein [Helianthus annuus]|nr:putative PGG domain-containing protein [Helianthus annuus]
MRALMRAGVVDAENESLLEQIPQNCISKMGFWDMNYYRKLNSEKDLKNNDDWLNNKRNTLMVVTSLLATMAFQAGTNPPSGVWQDDSTAYPPHKAGYAVMVRNHPNLYHIFLVSNTVGFVSTLSIILLLISGLP